MEKNIPRRLRRIEGVHMTWNRDDVGLIIPATTSVPILFTFSAKLHYTDTGYGHVVYNTTNGQAHNNSTSCCTTNLPHRSDRAQHLEMLGCGKFLSVGGEFVLQQVVELL